MQKFLLYFAGFRYNMYPADSAGSWFCTDYVIVKCYPGCRQAAWVVTAWVSRCDLRSKHEFTSKSPCINVHQHWYYCKHAKKTKKNIVSQQSHRYACHYGKYVDSADSTVTVVMRPMKCTNSGPESCFTWPHGSHLSVFVWKKNVCKYKSKWVQIWRRTVQACISTIQRLPVFTTEEINPVKFFQTLSTAKLNMCWWGQSQK